MMQKLCQRMRRLLASGLLPQRAGQPVKALAHIHFTELLALDKDSVLQDTWITDYRARWAAHRAAASAGPSDGGAWLTGEAARAVACDAMIVPVVTGDLDPDAIEDLIGLCVRYDQARHGCPALDAPQAETSETLGRLEQQILGRVIQIVSGPGGLASFLRRNLLGRPLGGPSLPLDVGQVMSPSALAGNGRYARGLRCRPDHTQPHLLGREDEVVSDTAQLPWFWSDLGVVSGLGPGLTR